MELHLFRPRSKELFKLNLGTLVQIAAKPQWNKTSLLWLSKTTGRQPHLCSAFSSLLDSFSTADEQNGRRLLAWLLQYSGFTRDCLNHFSQMTAESTQFISNQSSREDTMRHIEVLQSVPYWKLYGRRSSHTEPLWRCTIESNKIPGLE